MVETTINKIISIRWLQDIIGSFSALMPYAIVISLFILTGSIVKATEFQRIVETMSTYGIQFIFIVLAYNLINKRVSKNVIELTALGTLSFITLSGELNAKQLMIFIGWLLLVLYIFEVTKKILNRIKMNPNKIPLTVSELINTLLTSVITWLVVGAFVLILKRTAILNSLTLIESLVMSVMNYFPIYFLLLTGLLVLWTNGIHGDQIVGMILDPLLIIMTLVNLQNVRDPYIVNASFHVVFAMGTGTGMTGMLVLAYQLFGKNKQETDRVKELGTGAIFNINEPVIFGLPVVQNRKLRVPFIIAPLASITFAYAMTQIGIAKPLIYPVSWITPPLLKSFLASGGDMKTVLVELGTYLIALCIYAMYVLRLNRKEVVQ